MSSTAPNVGLPVERPPVPATGLRGLVASLLVMLGLVFPVGSIALACYSKNFLRRTDSRTFILYAAFIALTLAFAECGQAHRGRRAGVPRFLHQIRLNIQGGFASAVLNATGRTELGFYSISYGIYLVCGETIKPITVFWTFVTYFAAAMSFVRIFRDQIRHEYALAIFVFCTMLFINFALTAQVTRQYVAGALIVAAFVYYDRRILSFAMVAFAASVHNSAAVFMIPWLYVWAFGSRTHAALPRWLIIGALIGLALAGSVIYNLVDYLSGGMLGWFKGALLDNGELTAFKVLSTLVAVVVLQYEMEKRFDRGYLPFAVAFFFLVALLATVWKLPLFLLRFSFYVEFFAAISISMLLFRIARRLPALTLLILPILANAVLLGRAFTAPWTYFWLRDGWLANFVGELAARTFIY